MMQPPSLAWRRTMQGSVVLSLLLIAVFWSTVDTMVQTWLANETYSHGFLILPISLWLAWRRRDRLAAIAPQSAPWVLSISRTCRGENCTGPCAGSQYAATSFRTAVRLTSSRRRPSGSSRKVA